MHHTHPRVPWFRTKRESSYFTGQVQATVHVELPKWVELLLHNITVHGAFITVTRACKLYDYEAHRWRTFREIPGRSSTLHREPATRQSSSRSSSS